MGLHFGLGIQAPVPDVRWKGAGIDVGGNETEILRCAQNDRARCPIGPGIKGRGEKL